MIKACRSFMLFLVLLVVTIGFFHSGLLLAQSVPSEYVRHFFGAAHLKTEYHPLAEAVGVTWGRLGTRWHRQEPEKDQYDFSDYDRLMESANSHGIHILPLIGHSALWASAAPPDEDPKHFSKHPPREDMIDQWREYVEMVVSRYPTVDYFEVWNEPNIDWFLRVEENYKIYVDRILMPAAEIIHKHGRKVVGLSFTTEWPLDSWPPKSRPLKYSENVEANVRDINRWLQYHDAWKYVDILAVHYTHGDVEKPGHPHAQNMMPFYDWIYQEWIEPGKLEGIWNTEAGFAGVEAGNQGFVALDFWEHSPLTQWVARYTVPVLHWAIRHNWHFRDQYKLFWYHMSVGDHPRDLLKKDEDGLSPTPVAQTLHTVATLFSGSGTTGVFLDSVRTGFGIFSPDPKALNWFPPWGFQNYAFTVDGDILIAIWCNLPHSDAFGQKVQVMINGIPQGQVKWVSSFHYITGDPTPITAYHRTKDGVLRLAFPSFGHPILYLKIALKD